MTGRGRPWGGARAASLTWVPGARRCPGDMMIDRVSPVAGMRPLSLIRASAWPGVAGPAAADRRLAGAGRGGPHRVIVAVFACPGRRVMRLVIREEAEGQAAASASSPGSARMWGAWRRILRASDKAARLPFL